MESIRAYNRPVGRFGPVEGLILLALQFIAVANAMRPAGIPWAKVAWASLASYAAAFVAHIIGFAILPDDVGWMVTRPVIALVWFAASALACMPFLPGRRYLMARCGLLCMLAYLVFAFSMDYFKPA